MNPTRSSIFAVFPGQGSQQVGMAKELYENFTIARETFEEASDAIRVDLKKLCFEGPESDLTLTENTQPCLLAASVATYRVVEKELNWTPGAVAGHSLGEYSALVATRSLSLDMATRWVRERGATMQRAVPPGEGSMAAILGLEDDTVEKLCSRATAISQEKRRKGETPSTSVEAVVNPANFNAPGQVVIAGTADAIQEAIHLIKSSDEFPGGKAIALQVSAPFHCQLMRPARERMADLFSQASPQHQPRTPACPYVPNRTARLTQEAGIIFELLIEQVDHPVLWKQSVLTLLDQHFTTAIEFGPGKVLTGLMKRIAAHAGKSLSLANVSDLNTLKGVETLLK